MNTVPLNVLINAVEAMKMLRRVADEHLTTEQYMQALTPAMRGASASHSINLFGLWCRSERTVMNAIQMMDARDEAHRATLERIGQEIGYGRAQQMLGEAWDAMLDREYPSPAGTPRSGRGRMGVGANVPVGEVVIGPSPIDGREGFTMVRWSKERGCPPVGTRLYAEKLHPANT